MPERGLRHRLAWSSIAVAWLLLGTPSLVSAQATAPQGQAAEAEEGWTVAIYPVVGWLPLFGASLDLPAFPDVPGDGGASLTTESSLEGAFLAGVAVQSDRLTFEASGLWAGLSATVERPNATVDSDVVYGEAFGGVRLNRHVALIGGVRRLAVKVSAEIVDLPRFERKPGLWDPLVGMQFDWQPWTRGHVQTTVLGGGFGVGSDVDLSARLKMDWQLARHVGLVMGYQILYFDISHTVAGRTFDTQQTLHGPILGIGIYF